MLGKDQAMPMHGPCFGPIGIAAFCANALEGVGVVVATRGLGRAQWRLVSRSRPTPEWHFPCVQSLAQEREDVDA